MRAKPVSRIGAGCLAAGLRWHDRSTATSMRGFNPNALRTVYCLRRVGRLEIGKIFLPAVISADTASSGQLRSERRFPEQRLRELSD